MESIRTKLKAVIFDMDGVLMDTEEVSIRVYRNILNEYGCEMSIEEYGQHYSGKSEEENVQTLIEQFALPLDPQNFVTEAIRLEAAELERGIKLKPGVMDILSWLRQNKIAYALATSSERRRADKLLQMHQLENTFSVRTDSSDFCRGKPDPEVFQITLQKLHLKPEECLVVEDSENGVLAAYAAGIPVVMIPDMKQPSELIKDRTAAVLSSLNDLAEWILVHYSR